MKTWIIAAAAGAWLAAGSAWGDLTIVSKVEGMGQDMETRTEFKGGHTRIDTAPNTTLIMDLKSGDLIQLTRSQKTYLKVPGQITQEAVDGIKKSPGATARPQLAPTGRKDTISGFAAEEYACNVEGTRLSLWLTRVLPGYEEALAEMSAAFRQGPLASMMQSYGLDLASLPGFPIRTVSELQPGQSLTTTVVSVSTKPLADADFEVPAGYREISVPTLTPPAGAPASPAPPGS